MRYVFITGIPTAGKSHLAKKVAQKTNCIHVDIDDLRDPMTKNPSFEPWVNFFANQDEEKYWQTVTPEEHWNNLVKQSEAFWPTILKKIHDIQQSGQSAIFEGVNILPHLAHKDLDFSGVALIGSSQEEVFQRCKKEPRWGESIKVQYLEAEWFFMHEGKMYEQEAHKYGYKTFRNSEEAEKELLHLLQYEPPR